MAGILMHMGYVKWLEEAPHNSSSSSSCQKPSPDGIKDNTNGETKSLNGLSVSDSNLLSLATQNSVLTLDESNILSIRGEDNTEHPFKFSANII